MQTFGSGDSGNKSHSKYFGNVNPKTSRKNPQRRFVSGTEQLALSDDYTHTGKILLCTFTL